MVHVGIAREMDQGLPRTLTRVKPTTHETAVTRKDSTHSVSGS